MIFWKPIIETDEYYGMGMDTIQYQQHRFLPIYRWRPRTKNKEWHKYEIGYYNIGW